MLKTAVIAVVLAAAATPAAARESLAEFFEKRAALPMEHMATEGRTASTIPVKVTTVGTDFVCFLLPESDDQIVRCYPFSAIQSITDGKDKVSFKTAQH